MRADSGRWVFNTAIKVVANKHKLIFKGQGESDTK
jgi:hypothetical protein